MDKNRIWPNHLIGRYQIQLKRNSIEHIPVQGSIWPTTGIYLITIDLWVSEFKSVFFINQLRGQQLKGMSGRRTHMATSYSPRGTSNRGWILNLPPFRDGTTISIEKDVVTSNLVHLAQSSLEYYLKFAGREGVIRDQSNAKLWVVFFSLRLQVSKSRRYLFCLSGYL